MSILTCININGGCLPNFYILKGTYLLEDYVVCYKEGVVMDMQLNVWMMRWLFENWIPHFIECLKIRPSVDQNNKYLLILDGYNSHIILEVMRIAMESRLDIISLPSYLSHTLQPLEVLCFKSFKIAFRKQKDLWTLPKKNK